eukprot:12269338-Alexandrium_andersonii.AAC.1
MPGGALRRTGRQCWPPHQPQRQLRLWPRCRRSPGAVASAARAATLATAAAAAQAAAFSAASAATLAAAASLQ